MPAGAVQVLAGQSNIGTAFTGSAIAASQAETEAPLV
jgi:hypothetical protein